MLGITPASFFKAKCLTNLLELSESDILLESIEILDEREEEEEEGNQEFSPYGFELSGSGPGSTSSSSMSSTGNATVRNWTAYAALHRPNRILAPERLILELELIDQSSSNSNNNNSNSSKSPELKKSSLEEEQAEIEVSNSNSPSTEQVIEPSEILSDVVEATEEDVYESTVAIAIPLKEMVRLKRRREREMTRRAQAGESEIVDAASLRQRDDQVARDSHLHVVQLLGQVEDQLARAQDLTSFYKVCSFFLFFLAYE